MFGLGCFVSVAQTAFIFGVSLTSAASTGLVSATAPVWEMLLGSVLGLERPTGRSVVGVGSTSWASGSCFMGGLAGAEWGRA